MAKQAENKAKKSAGQSKAKGNDRDTKNIAGILICTLSLFMEVAFFYYLFNWKAYGANHEFTGEFGMKIAGTFIRRFGTGALLVPVALFLAGCRLLRPGRRFMKTLFALLSGTLLLSLVPAWLLHWMPDAYRKWFGEGVGGSFGYSTLNMIIAKTGEIGALLCCTLLTFAYSLFVAPRKTKRLIAFLCGTLPAAIARFFSIFVSDKSEKGESEEPVKSPPPSGLSESTKPNGYSAYSSESPFLDRTPSLDRPLGNPTDNPPAPDDRSDKNSSDDDDELIVVRRGDETPPAAPDIPSYKRAPEFNTSVVKEKYLPEDSLIGELYDPTKDLSGYKRPPVDLLIDYKSSGENGTDREELNRNKDKIVQILGHYKIAIDKIYATVGPTVTLYEVVPREGIRIAQIKRLEDDIALRIAAIGVRIIAPIPGKGTVGIEVPNEHPDIVSMRSIITSAKYQESKFELPVVLGKTILGEVYAFDLVNMPHLLVAGATGQGKSVGLNAILTSLLYKKHPAELKIVMVDPKKVELTPYNKIEKHFLAKLPDTAEPIITDTQKVIHTLKSLCLEMDNRYDLLKAAGVRNVKEYNDKFVNRHLNPMKGHRYLPYVVLVIDEFADLIMTAGREIEEPIARLAQLARATGMHLVIATQRPTTNIITGLIKANFPARIAFRVTAMVDSRTIIDAPGANQLIGRGDMLVSTGAQLIRVQCAFVDTPEIDRLTDYISTQPGYAVAYDLPEYVDEKSAEKQIDMENLDDMFESAAKLIVESQIGSTSLIQRKFSLGYNRAGRIMDQLQAAGIVGAGDSSKPRKVLITDLASLDHILKAFVK
jgi:S-DNA-T family DNA segregation ATPase FtsK/SpoIIIE